MASLEEIKDYIFHKVESYAGKKQVKVPQMTQEVMEHFGESCTKKDVKEALKELIDDEKLVYGYFGGTTLELPHKEGSAN